MTLRTNADNLTEWRTRPYNTVRCAAALLDCSSTYIYHLTRRGELRMVKLAGRTMVETATLTAFIGKAAPWTSGRDVRPAVEARRKSRAAFQAARVPA